MSDTQKEQKQIQENIVAMFGIDRLGEGEREEMTNKIGKIIFQSVLIRVLPTLSDEEAKEYEKLIDNGALPHELLNFFFEKVPNFLEIVTEESETFRKESAEVLKRMK